MISSSSPVRCRGDGDARSPDGGCRRRGRSRRRVPSCDPHDAAGGLGDRSGRSAPRAISRTRTVKSSAPLSSALQASSRWSGECAVAPMRKNGLPAASASPSRIVSVAPPPRGSRQIRGCWPPSRWLTEIGIGPVGRRNRRVVFLDPALHLREQDVLQRDGSGEGRLRIGVFGLEIGADIGIEQARIAHDRLPIGVLEPGELVGQGDAVPHRGRGAGRGAGRRLGRRGEFG